MVARIQAYLHLHWLGIAGSIAVRYRVAAGAATRCCHLSRAISIRIAFATAACNTLLRVTLAARVPANTAFYLCR